MGVKIRNTTMIIGDDEESSIDIAASAASECLKGVDIDRSEVGLLLNIGIHRDKNIVEPAVASLIQMKTGLNLNPRGRQMRLGTGTLSFDVLHGTCGFLYAIQIIDAYFKSGTCEKALIVSSDVHPSGKNKPGFPYTPSAGAMLLEKANDGTGFRNFMFHTAENGSEGLKQYVDTMAYGNNVRKKMTVEFEEDYESRLKIFTLSTMKHYIQKFKINLLNINHIITSTISNLWGERIVNALGFKNNKFLKWLRDTLIKYIFKLTKPRYYIASLISKILGREISNALVLGITSNPLVDIFKEFGDTNTSAPIIGYHNVTQFDPLKEGDQILFISSGSGLSFACALYEHGVD